MGLYQDVNEDGSGNVYVNLQDGSANGITSTAVTGGIQALDVYVQGSGLLSIGVPDQSDYIYGASGFQPVGGVYQDTGATLTAGQSGAFRLTSERELIVTDTDADASLASIDSKLSPSSASLTQLALSSSSQTALALNASRKGFIMVNDSNKTVWVAFNATASSSAYTYKILKNSTIEPNFGSYTGVISAISESGVSGNLVITELS